MAVQGTNYAMVPIDGNAACGSVMQEWSTAQEAFVPSFFDYSAFQSLIFKPPQLPPESYHNTNIHSQELSFVCTESTGLFSEYPDPFFLSPSYAPIAKMQLNSWPSAKMWPNKLQSDMETVQLNNEGAHCMSACSDSHPKVFCDATPYTNLSSSTCLSHIESGNQEDETYSNSEPSDFGHNHSLAKDVKILIPCAVRPQVMSESGLNSTTKNESFSVKLKPWITSSPVPMSESTCSYLYGSGGGSPSQLTHYLSIPPLDLKYEQEKTPLTLLKGLYDPNSSPNDHTPLQVKKRLSSDMLSNSMTKKIKVDNLENHAGRDSARSDERGFSSHSDIKLANVEHCADNDQTLSKASDVTQKYRYAPKINPADQNDDIAPYSFVDEQSSDLLTSQETHKDIIVNGQLRIVSDLIASESVGEPKVTSAPSLYQKYAPVSSSNMRFPTFSMHSMNQTEEIYNSASVPSQFGTTSIDKNENKNNSNITPIEIDTTDSDQVSVIPANTDLNSYRTVVPKVFLPYNCCIETPQYESPLRHDGALHCSNPASQNIKASPLPQPTVLGNKYDTFVQNSSQDPSCIYNVDPHTLNEPQLSSYFLPLEAESTFTGAFDDELQTATSNMDQFYSQSCEDKADSMCQSEASVCVDNLSKAYVANNVNMALPKDVINMSSNLDVKSTADATTSLSFPQPCYMDSNTDSYGSEEKDLHALTPEYHKLLKNIPKKSREAFTPSDLTAFRTCHPYYSPNCYILMQNGYDIRLGEVGRAALKKEISRRLKADAHLRDKCVSIVCRLKNANVLQLLQMAEISGCLGLGLKISSCYWKEYSKKQQRPNGCGSNRRHSENRYSHKETCSVANSADTPLNDENHVPMLSRTSSSNSISAMNAKKASNLPFSSPPDKSVGFIIYNNNIPARPSPIFDEIWYPNAHKDSQISSPSEAKTYNYSYEQMSAPAHAAFLSQESPYNPECGLSNNASNMAETPVITSNPSSNQGMSLPPRTCPTGLALSLSQHELPASSWPSQSRALHFSPPNSNSWCSSQISHSSPVDSKNSNNLDMVNDFSAFYGEKYKPFSVTSDNTTSGSTYDETLFPLNSMDVNSITASVSNGRSTETSPMIHPHCDEVQHKSSHNANGKVHTSHGRVPHDAENDSALNGEYPQSPPSSEFLQPPLFQDFTADSYADYLLPLSGDKTLMFRQDHKDSNKKNNFSQWSHLDTSSGYTSELLSAENNSMPKLDSLEFFRVPPAPHDEKICSKSSLIDVSPHHMFNSSHTSPMSVDPGLHSFNVKSIFTDCRLIDSMSYPQQTSSTAAS